MENKINGDTSGRGCGCGTPPRQQQRERKRLNTLDTGSEKEQHHPGAEGSSQLVREKRRRVYEVVTPEESDSESDSESEEEAGPETQTIEKMSRQIDDAIRQLFHERATQAADRLSHQLSEVSVEEMKIDHLESESATYELGNSQLRKKILEIMLEDAREPLRIVVHVDMNGVNEEVFTLLREARYVLEKLQDSASPVRRQSAEVKEAPKADYLRYISASFQLGIAQLNEKILEIMEENGTEKLRTADVESNGKSHVNEEVCTLLREAHNVLKELQDSATSARRQKGAEG